MIARSVLAMAALAALAPSLIAQGSIVSWGQAEWALTDGRADLVEMTRAQIADPDLATGVFDQLLDDHLAFLGEALLVVWHLQMFLALALCEHAVLDLAAGIENRLKDMTNTQNQPGILR